MNPSVKKPSISGADKQGHLGDLTTKTTPELKELLNRQQNIMDKQRHILEQLPDKGMKVQTMINTLTELLASREGKMEEAVDLFERLSVTADAQNHSRTLSNHGDDHEALKSIVNRAPETVIDDRRINAYDHVISKQKQASPSAQLSSRNLRASQVSELSPEILRTKPSPLCESKSVSPGKTLQQLPKSGKLKYRYDEALERDVHGSKSTMAVAIDIKEAIQLQMQHKNKLEELQILDATKKLAARFNPQMKTYNPDTGALSYREANPEFDEDDSDDDESVVDYD